MRQLRFVLLIITIATGLFSGHSAFAQSAAGCGAGNQDSTCLGRVTATPRTPPTCSTAAGWTTVVPAQWIGSQYSAPQCNYQAPPSPCPDGDTTTSPASWNGSQWVDPVCAAPAPPSCPSGFQCGMDGNPYAGFIGYCGYSFDGLGRNGRVTWNTPYFQCATTLAGASAQTGRQLTTQGYSPQTWFYLQFANSNTCINCTAETYAGTAVPSGTVLQEVYLNFNSGWTGAIVYQGTPSNLVNTGYTAPNPQSSTWVFYCPSTYPNLNYATVAAYADSNPSLIECSH